MQRTDATTIEIAETGYPFLRLIASYGHALVVLIVIAIAAAGVAATALGQSWIWAAAGVAGAVVLYGLLRSYVELVQIIRETLLPP